MRRRIVSLSMLCTAYWLVNCSESGKGGDTQPKKSEVIIPRAEYTAEEPGEWVGKENEHLPQVEILPDEKEKNILIQVNLKSRSQDHYIERIGIMAEDKSDVDGVSFSRSSSHHTARLTLYPVPRESKYKVYAKCNLHDLWTM